MSMRSLVPEFQRRERSCRGWGAGYLRRSWGQVTWELGCGAGDLEGALGEQITGEGRNPGGRLPGGVLGRLCGGP